MRVLLGLRHAALGRLRAVARLVELAAGGGQLSVDRRLLTLQLLLANPVGVLGLLLGGPSGRGELLLQPRLGLRLQLLCLLVELAAGVRGGILLRLGDRSADLPPRLHLALGAQRLGLGAKPGGGGCPHLDRGGGGNALGGSRLLLGLLQLALGGGQRLRTLGALVVQLGGQASDALRRGPLGLRTGGGDGIPLAALGLGAQTLGLGLEAVGLLGADPLLGLAAGGVDLAKHALVGILARLLHLALRALLGLPGALLGFLGGALDLGLRLGQLLLALANPGIRRLGRLALRALSLLA